MAPVSMLGNSLWLQHQQCPQAALPHTSDPRDEPGQAAAPAVTLWVASMQKMSPLLPQGHPQPGDTP